MSSVGETLRSRAHARTTSTGRPPIDEYFDDRYRDEPFATEVKCVTFLFEAHQTREWRRDFGL